MLLPTACLLSAALAHQTVPTQPACSPEDCHGGIQEACPFDRKLQSKPVFGKALSNLYFRNAAPYPAEVYYRQQDGSEVSHGIIGPGVRKSVGALEGDVWLARAVRPGHKGHQRLMAEHPVGAVHLKDCSCPQPEFVDCSKPPFMGPRWTPPDPITFVNHAGAAVDLFYWNGTCEELINWDDVGGMQPSSRKYIESTQGHTFRIRSSGNGRQMLMQHTLADVVLRGCDEEDPVEVAGQLEQLELEVGELYAERDILREQLAAEVGTLLYNLKLKVNPNATSTATAVQDETSGVAPYVAGTVSAGGVAAALLGVAKA